MEARLFMSSLRVSSSSFSAGSGSRPAPAVPPGPGTLCCCCCCCASGARCQPLPDALAYAMQHVIQLAMVDFDRWLNRHREPSV